MEQMVRIDPSVLDIDECSQGNPCPSNSNCTNTDGSFVCTCLSGFREQNQGSDLQCNGMILINPILSLCL